MLSSTEHEISLGHINKNTKNLKLFHAQLSWACSAELSMKEVSKFCQYFKIYKQNKFHAQLSWAWKKFYNLRPGFNYTENMNATVYIEFLNGSVKIKYAQIGCQNKSFFL